MLRLEDILHFLLGTVGNRGQRECRQLSQSRGPPPTRWRGTGRHSLAQLLPALEEILRSHLRGLEKLVECDRQLHRHILKGSPIPVSNTEARWEESTSRACHLQGTEGPRAKGGAERSGRAAQGSREAGPSPAHRHRWPRTSGNVPPPPPAEAAGPVAAPGTGAASSRSPAVRVLQLQV